MNTSSTRNLPTYKDAIVSYSLRIPTYRSTHIRRYHPYARYTKDEIDYNEPFLNLSVLDRRVEPVRVEPTTIEGLNHCHNLSGYPAAEQPHELPEAPVPAADNGVGEQEELNGRPYQNIVFMRVDVTSNS